jgi:hypothetical protein
MKNDEWDFYWSQSIRLALGAWFFLEMPTLDFVL